jgi:hypothetical protein
MSAVSPKAKPFMGRYFCSGGAGKVNFIIYLSFLDTGIATIQAMAEYKTVRKLSSEEAAYLAGLIDGEGTITLSRREKNAERTVVVSIANTELCLLEYPLEIISAGRISSKRTFKATHTPSFSYQLTGRQAIALIVQIEPFLRSYKKQRAQLIIRDYVRLTPRNGRYSVALMEERNRFVECFFADRINKNNPRGRVIF